MNKMLTGMVSMVLVGSLALMSSATALAGGTRMAADLGGQGAKVPVFELRTLTTAPGEGRDVLVTRTGQYLRNFTSSSGYEACATICKTPDGNQWGLIVATNNSHIACGVTPRCPEGMVPTADSIHSHTQVSFGQVNDADVQFLRARHPGQHIDTHGHYRLNPEKFSTYDYDGGPGYLIVGDTIKYQSGSSTDRVVGTLPPVADAYAAIPSSTIP